MYAILMFLKLWFFTFSIKVPSSNLTWNVNNHNLLLADEKLEVQVRKY